MHICAVAVEYETKTGRINKGVATSWLRAKEPAGENGGRALVPMYVRKSQFRLPFKIGRASCRERVSPRV